jgi:hypothetical protein
LLAGMASSRDESRTQFHLDSRGDGNDQEISVRRRESYIRRRAQYAKAAA